MTKTVADSERVLVVTYNPKLAKTQWMTLQNDVAKASQRLSELQGRLAGRAAGLIKGGKRPTLASVEQKCRSILRRQHLKDAIQVTIEGDPKGHPQLNYVIATDALDRIAETHLGKTILISNRSEWTDERIIEAYRSQFLIEAVFREMKDRTTGGWWPLNHWMDPKLRVHGLYCSMAQLLRSVIWHRIHHAGLDIVDGPVAFEVGRHPRSDQPVPQATQGCKSAAANGADADVEGPEVIGRDSRSRTRGRR